MSKRWTTEGIMTYGRVLRRVGSGVMCCATFGCAGIADEPAEHDAVATAKATLVGAPDPNSQVDLLSFSNGMDPAGGNPVDYFSAYIRVANLANEKYVAIAGTTGSSAPWRDYPAQWVESYPDGTELWVAYGSVNLTQFAVKYSVSGQTYWDNNSGADYHAESGSDFFYGANIAVWPSSAYVDGAGQLHLRMVVKNIAYTKLVSARYTLDAWAHYNEANGTYYPYYSGRSYQGSQEYWEVLLPTVAANGVRTVTFAGRYQLPTLGQEYWTNQGGLNFTISCTDDYGCSID